MSADSKALHLQGELVRTPRGPAMTLLLAVTGVIVLRAAAGGVARLIFGLKRPAELFISADGVQLESRTELLGKTLRERREHVPVTALRSIGREVRYSSLSVYLGAAALCLGTYWGVALVVDGVRVPGTSPGLIGIGLLFLTLGIALDLALTLWVDKGIGRCQVILRPLRGPAWTLGRVDVEAADGMLQEVAKLKGYATTRAKTREALPVAPGPTAEALDDGAPLPPIS